MWKNERRSVRFIFSKVQIWPIDLDVTYVSTYFTKNRNFIPKIWKLWYFTEKIDISGNTIHTLFYHFWPIGLKNLKNNWNYLDHFNIEILLETLNDNIMPRNSVEITFFFRLIFVELLSFFLLIWGSWSVQGGQALI